MTIDHQPRLRLKIKINQLELLSDKKNSRAIKNELSAF